MRKFLSIFTAMLCAIAVSADPVVLPATLDVNNVSFRSEGMPDFVLEEGDYAGTYFDMGAHDSSNDTLLYAEWDVTIEPIMYTVGVVVYNTNSWRVQLDLLNQADEVVKAIRYKGSSGQCGQYGIGTLDLTDLAAGNYKVRVHAATAWSAMKLKDVIFVANYAGVNVDLPGTLLPAYAELSSGATVSNNAIAFDPATANSEFATWNVTFAEAGNFDVTIDMTASNGHTYGVALLSADGATEIGAVAEEQAWDTGVKALGSIAVPAAGSYKVKLTNATQWSEALLNSITFAVPAPVLETGFYLVGSFNSWTPAAEYHLVGNPDNNAEFMINVTLAENDELKVVNVLDGAITAWFPGGNNYVVDAAHAGDKTVYFRPDYQGGDDWYEHCIYIAPNEDPQPEMTTIYDWAGEIGTTIFGGNSNITTGTVKIHENTDAIDGIKFGSSYVYTEGKYIAIKPAEGGFKAGDVLSVSVVFNNSDATKYCMVDLRAADGDTRIWMSDSLSTLNGRNAGEPVVQTYTLAADQDSLFLGRYGNTGMFITLLKVERAGGETPVEPETIPTTAPAVPTQDEANVMGIYCNHYATNNAHFGISGWAGGYDVLDLDGTTAAYWAGMTWECIIDPANIDAAHDFSAYENIHVDMWAPAAAKIKFTAEAVAGGNYKDGQVLDLVQGWNSFDIAIADWAGNYDFANLKCFVLEQYQTPEGESFEGNPFAIANIYFWNAPVATDTYTVAGGSADLFGTTWDPTNVANDMALQEDGTYKFEKTEITLPAGNVEFKVCQNHAWTNCWPAENYQLVIPEAGVYTITITYNPEGNVVAGDAVKTGDAVVDPVVSIAGSMNSWNASADVMVLAEDKATASLTLNLAAQTYEFKVVINGGDWRSNAQEFTRENATAAEMTGNEANMHLVADMAGDYVFTWTFATNTLVITYPSAGPEPLVIPTEAPVPTAAEEDVMGIFCNHYPNNNANFGISGWAGGYQILDLNGINVGYWTGMTWECIIDPAHTDDPHDFSAYKNIHIDLWAPLPAKIKFTAEAVAGGNYKDGQVVEMQQGWNSVDFAVAEWPGNYDFKNLKCFVFEQYQTLAGESFEGNPFAFANIYFFGKEEQGIDNTAVEMETVKTIMNGQLVIIKNGVMYNAQGAIVR